MNQHYVPRLYLKNFSKKKGKEYFVDVYEKGTKRIFNTNIKNICAEKDIYTLDKNSNFHSDAFVFEKIYAEWIEPLYQKAYDILTNDKIFIISTTERIEVLTGILQLYYRNPHILADTLESLCLDIKNQFSNRGKEDIGFTYLSEYFSYNDWNQESVIQYFIKELTNEYKEKHLLETQKIIDFHKNSIFEVSKIIDEGSFITSDNPLSIEDIVNPSRNPLVKSKEFTIPLNHKYALKIFHDNSKELNKIYRIGIPNGNAAYINSTIDDQCIRFLVGEEKSFTQYFHMLNFLHETSVELQIDALRQILSKFPETPDTAESNQILKSYIEQYDREGTLTEKEQFEMHLKLKQAGIKIKQRKI